MRLWAVEAAVELLHPVVGGVPDDVCGAGRRACDVGSLCVVRSTSCGASTRPALGRWDARPVS